MKKKNGLSRKEKHKVMYAITLVTQIGISMMVPIAICVAIGVIIYNKTSSDIAVPIAILLGVITAFRNVFIMTRNIYAKDLERENKELKYFEDLKKEREKGIESEEKLK